MAMRNLSAAVGDRVSENIAALTESKDRAERALLQAQQTERQQQERAVQQAFADALARLAAAPEGELEAPARELQDSLHALRRLGLLPEQRQLARARPLLESANREAKVTLRLRAEQAEALRAAHEYARLDEAARLARGDFQRAEVDDGPFGQLLGLVASALQGEER